MSEPEQGLLVGAATAIGATLGRVASTAKKLVRTARRKAPARPGLRARKTSRHRKAGIRASAAVPRKASRAAHKKRPPRGATHLIRRSARNR